MGRRLSRSRSSITSSNAMPIISDRGEIVRVQCLAGEPDARNDRDARRDQRTDPGGAGRQQRDHPKPGEIGKPVPDDAEEQRRQPLRVVTRDNSGGKPKHQPDQKDRDGPDHQLPEHDDRGVGRHTRRFSQTVPRP